MSRILTGVLTVFVALAGTACGDDANMIGPSNQPEITNATDSFQLQASNLSNVSQILSYTWVNTGTRANVDQSGAVTDGTAVLVIRDSVGAEVYSRSLRETGSFTSASGAAGNWRIEVRLDEVDGTLNFRVQKP